jgi:hypothetical protein
VKRKPFTDGMGLRLSRQALRVLREHGIFAQSSVSLSNWPSATWCGAWSQAARRATSVAT